MEIGPQSNSPEELEKAIDEILCRVDILRVQDPRTTDEILDYDENGLPR